ncbi:MAG: cell surface protein [Deltaproteobacteria bacterium]|nr:cell surface protein [Deltaproteobacteria bacterium]
MRPSLALVAAALAGCGGTPIDPSDAPSDASSPCAFTDASARSDGRVVGGPYASRVVSFRAGEGASFGHSSMPDIVLGPPQGAGDLRGGTDTVSLGQGGEIVLGFDRDIVDGPGDDLVVFENAFMVPGVEERYWEELGEVSVSEDGVTWVTFPCDPRGARPHTGCAGWTPVYASPSNGLCPLDPRVAGGDGFDLATVRLTRARFVRIRDLSTQGLMAPATGFDLDAIGVLHGR